MEYDIAFANDWADDLAIKTSATVPANTWLPAPVAPTVLANLNGLTVTALNGSTVTVNTGVTPPSGGGFEIRLRDFAFMPGEDPTLVMRGAAAKHDVLARVGRDRFYIRMYDGSTPPNYSEFSTALFINLPLVIVSAMTLPEVDEQTESRRMRMMNEFEAQVLSDLSVLKTQMTGLMGDGNGGRLAELERRMERHEQNWQRAKGFLAAVSVLFAVIEVAFEAWHRH